jgi:hypothetical protein
MESARNLASRGDDEPFPFRREKPKNTRYHQQGRNIANEVTVFLSVGKGLHRHDQRMHDARPDGKSDQAAIGSRVLAAAIKKMPSTA